MTALSTVQRQQLEDLLARRRDQTATRIAALQRSFDDIVSASAEAVRDDEHDPEGATIAYERAQIAAFLADARAHLASLDAVAARLDDPTLGLCEACGGEIGSERLLARPTAIRCMSCAALAGAF